MKKNTLFWPFLLLLTLTCFQKGIAQQPAPQVALQNLVPNPNFIDGLQGWRTDFPHAGPYVQNIHYVKVAQAPIDARACVVIDLPPKTVGGEGGKIESAFLKAEPGATYRVEIDCLTWDFQAMLHVEAWVKDPKPIPQPDKFRIPATAQHPALLTCYRAQISPPKPHSKTWETIAREFTLPATFRVGGKDLQPEFLTLKTHVYDTSLAAGKSYFTNFRLYKIKSADKDGE